MKKRILFILFTVLMIASVFVLASCEDLFGLDHQHEYTTDVTHPTCTSQGYTTYTCSCGDTYKDNYVDKTYHTYGDWRITEKPTCTESGEETRICNNCSLPQTRKVAALGHNHSAVTTDPTCTEQGYTMYTCSCGDSYVGNYVSATGHNYSETVTPPTTEAQGYTTYTCSVCSDSYVGNFVGKLDHIYTEEVVYPNCTEQGYTVYTCTCSCGDTYISDYVDATGHSFGEWYETKEANCSEFGEEQHDCGICGYVETRITDLGDHIYNSYSIPPTCTERGYTVNACIYCPWAYESDYVDALGHSFGEWYVIEEANCSKQGEERRDCSVCGYYETRTTDFGDHAYNSHSIPPTCTERGYTVNTCINCPWAYESDYVDAPGHTFGEWYVIEEANCSKQGEEKRDCSVCGYCETRIIDLSDHIYDSRTTNPTCTEQGYTTIYCTLCDYSYQDSYTDKLPHEFKQTIIQPNCTEIGCTVNACINCTYTEQIDIVPPIGHSYGDWYEIVSATCSKEGEKQRDCNVCKNNEIQKIEKLEHNKIYHDAKDPTCTEAGWNKYETCSNCDYTTKGEEYFAEHKYNESNICVICGYINDEYFVFTLLEDNTYSIAAKNPEDLPNEIVIPSQYNKKPVTVIGDNAFSNCINITSITIPDSVREIGNMAFHNFSVKDVYITNFKLWLLITFNGEHSFPHLCGTLHILDDNGDELTNLVIPDGITHVPNYALYNAKNISSVTLSNSVNSIGRYSFANCTNLSDINTGDGVTDIDEGAFSNCTNIVNLTIGKRITKIGKAAFYNSSVKNIFVTNVEAWLSITFNGNDSCPHLDGSLYILDKNGNELTDLSIPDSITSIPDYAFYNVRKLSSVTFSNNIESIGCYAFANCTNLSNVNVGNSVRSVGEGAFSNCKNITNLTMGDSITEIGELAFHNSSILNVYVTDLKAWTSITFNGIDSYPHLNGTLHILDDNRNELTYLPLYDDITAIPDYAFYNAKNISSVNLSNDVESIGRYAFANCTNLSDVNIGNGVTDIDEGAFSSCANITNMTIGDNITRIGKLAFYNSSCKNIYVTDIEAWLSITFNGIDSYPHLDGTLHILDEKGDELTCLDYFGNATRIPDYAFCNAKNITKLDISDRIESIGSYSFSNCLGLSSINTGNGITSIGKSAFLDCKNILNVTIGNNILTIGDYAFYNTSDFDIYIRDIQSWTNISYGGNHARPNIYGTLHILDDNDDEITDLVIPENIISVPFYTFHNAKNITTVTIPEGVVAIEASSFSNCHSLREVIIPDSVTFIGSCAFRNCYGLTNTTLPENLTTIDMYAFQYCKSLTSLVIPSKLTSINSSAFQYCDSLYVIYNNSNIDFTIGSTSNGELAKNAKIIISNENIIYANDGYEYILTNDDFLFRCKGSEYDLIAYIGNKETVTLPTNVYGNSYSIYYMRGVINAIIPNSITVVNDCAFYDCDSIISITIPDSIKSIGRAAFSDCYNLDNVVIPGSVNTISSRAFHFCNNLTNVIMLDGVSKIDDYAFSYCYGLRELTIPDSVISIGKCAFYDTAYYNDENNWVDGILYIGNHLIEAKDTIPDEYSIKDETITIADYAFSECTNITGVIIPNSVISIGECAFNACSNLTNVVIGDNVICYGDNIFGGTNIQKATIPTSVISYIPKDSLQTVILTSGEYIPNDAFSGYYYLTSITLCDSIKSIGAYAFLHCEKLNYITFGDNSNLTSIGEGAFLYCVSLTNIIIPNGVTYIGDGAFAICDSLIKVTIPNSVTFIGDHAFDNKIEDITMPAIAIPYISKTSLRTVKITSGTTIDDYAFSTSDNLTSITICANVTSIGEYAFAWNSNLTDVILPNSVTYIDSYAFHSCRNLVNINIPNSVTSIDSYAFSNCSNLTGIVIPDSVTSIGDYAFYDCSSLVSVVIGDSVTSIGDWAFSSCSRLTDVYYTGTEEEWAEITIGSNNSYLTNATIHYNYVPEE